MLSILKLVLENLALDHTVKWSLIRLVKGRRLLINFVGFINLSEHTLLESNFTVVLSVFWLKNNSFFEHLECF